MNFDIQFYKGKNVFITGHTGFKGTWLCAILASAGANVTGYSLGYPTSPSLFKLSLQSGDCNPSCGAAVGAGKLQKSCRHL